MTSTLAKTASIKQVKEMGKAQQTTFSCNHTLDQIESWFSDLTDIAVYLWKKNRSRWKNLAFSQAPNHNSNFTLNYILLFLV